MGTWKELAIEPFYFGENEQLFGIYHAPRSHASGPAVLVCPPMLGEHLKAYWALRQVATRLATEGRPVLRFDLSGTGNSMGGDPAARPSIWVEDVRTAQRELEEQSGTRQLEVISVRYGTLLAELALVGRSVSSHVAWDPIFDGGAVADSLVLGRQRAIEATPVDLPECEYMGHRLASSFLGELRGQSCAGMSAKKNVVLASAEWDPAMARGHGPVTSSESICPWGATDLEVMYVHDIVNAICKSL